MNDGLCSSTVKVDHDEGAPTRCSWWKETKRQLERGLRRMAENRPGFKADSMGFREQTTADVHAAKARREARRRFKEEWPDDGEEEGGY